jgi:hypothetical protein
VISPGRDDNYPTSSGNTGAGMGGLFNQQLKLDGFAVSIGLLVLIIVALILWGVLKK